jgi:hypothetical protein
MSILVFKSDRQVNFIGIQRFIINFSKFFILNKLIFRFFKFSQGGLTCNLLNIDNFTNILILKFIIVY